jgi:hypothetical protein
MTNGNEALMNKKKINSVSKNHKPEKRKFSGADKIPYP